MSNHQIYLIPGFFGFANLGGITYFHHVRGILEESFPSDKLHIIEVETYPTASIRRRALHLARAIERQSQPSSRVHLIGHSTGGLDARLLASKEVNLSPDFDHKSIADRIDSVVTVSTPHYGTPVASFLDTILGQKILYIWSLLFIYLLRFGDLPLSVLLKFVGIMTKLDDHVGLDNTILDQFYRELFSQFDRKNRKDIQRYLNHILTDQSALGQITPGGIDLFNASVHNRPDIEYGSVVTEAKPPSFETIRHIGLNPYELGAHAIYQVFYRLASRTSKFSHLPDNAIAKLDKKTEKRPTNRDNDGLVPTKSQVWGEIIHFTYGDHLDVCGHFKGHKHTPPHIDWLTTGTGFNRRKFEALWHDVAEFLGAGI